MPEAPAKEYTVKRSSRRAKIARPVRGTRRRNRPGEPGENGRRHGGPRYGCAILHKGE